MLRNALTILTVVTVVSITAFVADAGGRIRYRAHGTLGCSAPACSGPVCSGPVCSGPVCAGPIDPVLGGCSIPAGAHGRYHVRYRARWRGPTCAGTCAGACSGPGCSGMGIEYDAYVPTCAGYEAYSPTLSAPPVGVPGGSTYLPAPTGYSTSALDYDPNFSLAAMPVSVPPTPYYAPLGLEQMPIAPAPASDVSW